MLKFSSQITSILNDKNPSSQLKALSSQLNNCPVSTMRSLLHQFSQRIQAHGIIVLFSPTLSYKSYDVILLYIAPLTLSKTFSCNSRFVACFLFASFTNEKAFILSPNIFLEVNFFKSNLAPFPPVASGFDTTIHPDLLCWT